MNSNKINLNIINKKNLIKITKIKMSLIRPGNYLSNLIKITNKAYLNLGRNTFKDSMKFVFSKDLNFLRIT